MNKAIAILKQTLIGLQMDVDQSEKKGALTSERRLGVVNKDIANLKQQCIDLVRAIRILTKELSIKAGDTTSDYKAAIDHFAGDMKTQIQVQDDDDID